MYLSNKENPCCTRDCVTVALQRSHKHACPWAGRRLFRSVRVPLWTEGGPRRVPGLRSHDRGPEASGFEWVPELAALAKAHRRGEIDLVAVTQQGVFALEIKNWSGKLEVLSMPGGVRWVQHRTGAGGELDHGDVLGVIKAKAGSLAEHLRRFGVDIPDSAVFARVVFVNPNLEIVVAGSGAAPAPPSTSRAAAPAAVLLPGCLDVIWPADVAAFVESFTRGPGVQLVEAVLPSWLIGSKVSGSQADAAARVLREKTGTWDELRLRSGAVLFGDFVGVQRIPSESSTILGLEGLGFGSRAATASLTFAGPADVAGTASLGAALASGWQAFWGGRGEPEPTITVTAATRAGDISVPRRVGGLNAASTAAADSEQGGGAVPAVMSAVLATATALKAMAWPSIMASELGLADMVLFQAAGSETVGSHPTQAVLALILSPV